MARWFDDVCFSNRPFGVKHFQTIHQCDVDVARGLVLLFGIGAGAFPSWDSRTRRNNLLVGLAVSVTADPSRHTNSPYPSSRKGHLSTARWSFSNRPFGVKHFQTIHQCDVDVARGLVLLFGIGAGAFPSWDSRTRRNNLLVGLAVSVTADPSRHTNSPYPSSRKGHLSTARWSFSNRPFGVKHFQTIHQCDVDVARGLVLLFGIGAGAFPSWDSRTRRNNLLVGLAVSVTADPSRHTNSPYPSSRKGHLSTARWSFSNRPFGVKHFQTIHQCDVDVARGLVLLFGIGAGAFPSWDSRTRRNNLLVGLAVSVTADPSRHTNSPYPSSRKGHLSTARWSFSNRPFGVKHFQTIHQCDVDVARGLVLLFGIGAGAFPSWDSRTRRNNLLVGLAVSVTADPSRHTNSPYPSSRKGHLSTARWSFSNRPFGVKHFQTIHQCDVDVARGLVLLFGIGAGAFPSWDSRTRRNNLLVGLAVSVTADPSRHTNSPYPSSRKGHLSTARWSFSNRPFGVKHFQTIHQCDVDVARGLVLLFGIGAGAFPSWDSRTRRNNLLVGLAVSVTADPSRHTNSPYPSSRKGHLSTARWSFSNRPFGVKHFQTIHQCDVDVARGLVLLFGIGAGAFPSWDSRTRRNNLLVGLAVSVTADPSRHTNSPYPSSRKGHLSTARWSFSNRPFGVKHFQTIHQCDVDVARGLVLLFGIGAGAFPSWDSRTRRNNLLVGLAVSVTADPSRHTNSPYPS